MTVDVDGTTLRLTRAEAADLRAALGDALAERRAFLRTVGIHRPDGAYEVARRGADSDGNAKVFDSFAALERLFDDLPDEFAAADVEYPGVSGGRRHMLVHHLAEHPAFPCEVVRRQPLTARKTP